MYKRVKLSENKTYSVDTNGKVWNDKTQTQMRGTTITSTNRYAKARLPFGTRAIHILVLEAFEGFRPSPKHTADHLDGDRSNNSLGNLEWVKHVENVRRYHTSVATGTHKGTPHKEPLQGAPNRAITSEEVNTILENIGQLRAHGGKKGLTIGQLLMKLNLTHINPTTAYGYVHRYRLANSKL